MGATGARYRKTTGAYAAWQELSSICYLRLPDMKDKYLRMQFHINKYDRRIFDVAYVADPIFSKASAMSPEMVPFSCGTCISGVDDHMDKCLSLDNSNNSL